MSRRVVSVLGFLLLLLWAAPGVKAQEDEIAQKAVQAVRTFMNVPRDMEIKFVEKRESQIPGFYAVRLLVSAPDRETPLVVYVDQTSEKIILGNLIIKGENVTRKEAGDPRPKRVDVALLELAKSPVRGVAGAKLTIVEYSNFQ